MYIPVHRNNENVSVLKLIKTGVNHALNNESIN